MTNKEWIDLLSKEWNVSRTVAKTMLHLMYEEKKKSDNLKKVLDR